MSGSWTRSAFSVLDKRMTRIFAINQDKLSKSKGLDHRKDLKNVSRRGLTFFTSYQYRAAREWFQKFLQICKSNLYDSTYFEIQSDVLYDSDIFKTYCVYVSQSRIGQINAKPSVSIISHMMNIIWRQIELSRRCQLRLIDKENVKNFVQNELKNQKRFNYQETFEIFDFEREYCTYFVRSL